MNKIIIANIKNKQTASETKNYAISLAGKTTDIKNKLIVCPPFTSLETAKNIFASSKIELGAQDVSQYSDGSLTGEVMPIMLTDLNIKYCILGHSERRKHFNETDKRVNKKIKNCLRNGIISIVCVGETGLDYQQGRTLITLENQITNALSGLYSNELASVIIAYEPVWAIGTGESLDTKQIDKIVASIKKIITELYSIEATKLIKIVYGGSVNQNNYKKILSLPSLDGVLIGGASLDAYVLSEIAKYQQ